MVQTWTQNHLCHKALCSQSWSHWLGVPGPWAGDGRFGGPVWWNTPMDDDGTGAEENRTMWSAKVATETYDSVVPLKKRDRPGKLPQLLGLGTAPHLRRMTPHCYACFAAQMTLRTRTRYLQMSRGGLRHCSEGGHPSRQLPNPKPMQGSAVAWPWLAWQPHSGQCSRPAHDTAHLLAC
jgi:hypothetical protein